MKIRLLQLDGSMPNIALMKISTYHKRLNDDVNWYSHIEDYTDTDILYISKLFNFTNDTLYLPENAKIIKGGTGYDITLKLPLEIDKIIDLDYSLYPSCDYSVQFLTRGCIRKCLFCVVPQKEGFIHKVNPMKLKSNSKFIKLFDNNFFAYKNWKENVDILKSYNLPIEFNQGLDLRIMNEEQAEALSTLKIKNIYTAYDHPNDKEKVMNGLNILLQYIKSYKITTYVLIGFNTTPEEDFKRVEELRDLKVNPYVMPFNKKDPYQKKFARWVNHKAIFKTVKWEDYK